MAATQNITIYRKEDILLIFTMSPVEDITGWSTLFTLRHSRTSVVLATITGTVTNGVGGVFQFVIPSATTDITAQKYIYDVVRTDASFDKVLSIGEFTIKSGVRTP